MAAVFCRGVNDICALLGFYAAQSGRFLLTLRHNLSVPFSRLKLTLTKGDGTDKLSRNVRKQVPFYGAYNPKRSEISFLQLSGNRTGNFSNAVFERNAQENVGYSVVAAFNGIVLPVYTD